MAETYEVRIRREKVDAVREISEMMGRSTAVLLTEYRGLTVQELAELRTALAQTETSYKVVKNTLARLAAREAGFEGLDESLEGPTAVAYCAGDVVAAAKALSAFAKDHPALVLKGAVLEGRFLPAEDAQGLATVDPLEVSLAKIMGLLTAPLQQVVGMLDAPLSQLVFALDQLAARGGPGAGEPATA